MRGRVPVTAADRTRLRQTLLELERGPDDKYLLLAIKGLLGEIGRS